MRVLREVARVLRPSGKYVLISHAVPNDEAIGYGEDGGSRLDWLTERCLGWDVMHEEIIQLGPMKFMAYVAQKR